MPRRYSVISLLSRLPGGYFNKFANDYAPVGGGTPVAFLILVTCGTALGFTAFHVAVRSRAAYTATSVRWGLVSGVLTTTQVILMAYGIRFVEVSRFFSTTACTAILLSTVFSMYLQKETPSTLTVTGIGLSIGAIVLFAIG